MTRMDRSRALLLAVACLLAATAARAQAPVEYKVTVPEAQHHWLQVEATFPELGSNPLHLEMSRSSPGRYALHEFAKNLFEIKAYDGKGLELALLRTSPQEWSVSGHDGTVRVIYKLYGDRVDGTYLAVDTTHLHLNMPAAFMWAQGLEMRSIRIRFEPPDPSWKVASQLFPTPEPLTFTAPNLQYFMDSPTEVGPIVVRSFTPANPDGRRFEFRIAFHSDGTDADLDDYAANVEKIVREEQAVFGEFPDYDTGTYTVIADYLPYADGDGMEHRNSTIVTSRLSITNPQRRMRALGTVAHEFFHCWNVERIRPAGLEPFDFTRANMSDGLWLAEGFTSYYGPLAMVRAGVSTIDQALQSFGGSASAAVNGSGRLFRSAAEMSRMAPFVDGAPSIDRNDLSTTFISYYT
jgi:predicted metalloprotease with PDZ domain